MIKESSNCASRGVVVNYLLTLQDANFSNLSVTFPALASISPFHKYGVRFIGTLIAEVSILSSIANALQPNFGKAWPTTTLVIIPDCVRNHLAFALVWSFA